MPFRPPRHNAKPARKPWGDWQSPNRLKGRKAVEWRRRILAGEPLCRRCTAKGVTRLAEELHHIIPLAKGGSNDRSNIEPLCVDCHRAITTGRPTYDEDGWPA